MFPYDPALGAAVQASPPSVAGVLQLQQIIDGICADTDGLKWFNWLYLQVTEAVAARVNTGGFADPAWLASLDVQFAKLYFNALEGWLGGAPCPACWRALFACRDHTCIARIQFALAGINAHINHDLPQAIVATCQAMGLEPQHGSAQYNDYMGVNSTLDSLVDSAKKTLNVRLPGDPLPEVSHLEDTIAAWNVSTARELAWNNAEALWHLESEPVLASGFMDSLDGLTTFASKALLVAVP